LSQGILYLAFGSEYLKLSLATLAHSRQFTDLPFHLISNLPVDYKWLDDNHVTTTLVDIPNDENRKVKTNLIEYTPFDRTLYLDCDSVINKPGIEQVFSFVDEHDIVLHKYINFRVGKKIFRIYKTAMINAGITLPLMVYSGAFVVFKQDNSSRRFFSEWNRHWSLNGCGRDMPSLACAAKTSGVDIREISKKDGIFSVMGTEMNCIVVHRGLGIRSLKHLFGIENYQQNKPFDKGRRGDWSMVPFNI